MWHKFLRWLVLDTRIDFGPLAPWLFGLVLGRRPRKVKR